MLCAASRKLPQELVTASDDTEILSETLEPEFAPCPAPVVTSNMAEIHMDPQRQEKLDMASQIHMEGLQAVMGLRIRMEEQYVHFLELHSRHARWRGICGMLYRPGTIRLGLSHS